MTREAGPTSLDGGLLQIGAGLTEVGKTILAREPRGIR